MEDLPLHLQAQILIISAFRGMPPSKSWAAALKWLREDTKMFVQWLISRSNGDISKALKRAARCDDVGAVKTLLTHKPDRMPALRLSIIKKRTTVLHELIQAAPLAPCDANELLGLAVIHNRDSMIKALVEAGATVDIRNLDAVVCSTKSMDAMQVMFDLMSQEFTTTGVERRDNVFQIMTEMLDNAARENRINVVWLLFKMGVSYKHSYSAFKHAALTGKTQVVWLFLRRGADARVCTAWHMDRIRTRGHHVVEEMLVDAGAPRRK